MQIVAVDSIMNMIAHKILADILGIRVGMLMEAQFEVALKSDV